MVWDSVTQRTLLRCGKARWTNPSAIYWHLLWGTDESQHMSTLGLGGVYYWIKNGDCAICFLLMSNSQVKFYNEHFFFFSSWETTGLCLSLAFLWSIFYSPQDAWQTSTQPELPICLPSKLAAFPCTSEFACSNYYENLNRNILCRFFTLHLCIYRLVWNLCNECSLSSTVFKIPFHPHGYNSLRSPFRCESPFPVKFNTEEVCIIFLGLGSLMPFSESGHIGDISDTSPSAALSSCPISPFLICGPSGFSTGYSIPVSKAIFWDQRALSPDMAVIIADIP